MFSETQDLFRFLLEMGKSCPKELFKIARCFRSYFVSFFESVQKVTERSRIQVILFFVIFTEGEKEDRLLPVFEAMDHRNLHYHTALQAVH